LAIGLPLGFVVAVFYREAFDSDSDQPRPPVQGTRMEILAAILLALVLAAGWVLQLVGLPGNWLIVAAVALYAWLIGPDAATALGWPAVIAILVLAIIGEVVEFAAGALGVTAVGGSRRGALLAIVGSMIGGILGLFVGLPIPVIGSLIAAIVFGGLGALAGAVVGETWKGHDFDTSLEIGKAAFVGRVLGIAGKMIICTLLVVVALAAVIL
jgi:uncharacterized protein